MLRASSETHAQDVDLQVVMNGDYRGDIAGGDALVALAEAVVSTEAAALTEARTRVTAELGEAALVDAVGVASNFQRMVRIADTTGIVLGRFETMTEGLRADLDINRFAAARSASPA